MAEEKAETLISMMEAAIGRAIHGHTWEDRRAPDIAAELLVKSPPDLPEGTDFDVVNGALRTLDRAYATLAAFRSTVDMQHDSISAIYARPLCLTRLSREKGGPNYYYRRDKVKAWVPGWLPLQRFPWRWRRIFISHAWELDWARDVLKDADEALCVLKKNFGEESELYGAWVRMIVHAASYFALKIRGRDRPGALGLLEKAEKLAVGTAFSDKQIALTRELI